MTGGCVERGGVRPKGACPIGEGLDRRVVNGEERGRAVGARERRRARESARAPGVRFANRSGPRAVKGACTKNMYE